MSYKTSGIISSVKWMKDSSSSNGTLTFTINPVSPYAFERKNKADTEKFVLWDAEDSKMPMVKVPVTAEYIATFGDSSMSFAALLLLKQNRTKIELECATPSPPSTPPSTPPTPPSTPASTPPTPPPTPPPAPSTPPPPPPPPPIPVSKLSVVG